MTSGYQMSSHGITSRSIDLDIAFVFKASEQDEILAHPVHKKWAQSIGAKRLGITAPILPSPVRDSFIPDVIGGLVDSVPTDHDVYVFENPSALYYLPMLESKSPQATKIYLETNWRRYPSVRMTSADTFLWEIIKIFNNHLDAFLLNTILDRYVDGFLTVSQMLAKRLSNNFDKPTAVVRPFIRTKISEQLNQISPTYESNKACFVGAGRYHKGIERLVNNWERVRKEVPRAKLTIVGRGHPAEYNNVDGVNYTGHIDNPSEVFSECSLYIHPAHFDACPVAVAEAMYAGLPCIVTDSTGSKEVVSVADASLICKNEARAIVDSVVDYFSSSINYRRVTGKRCRLVSKSLLEENRTDEFELVLERLLDRINNSEHLH